jgi:hypothetical protein
MDAEIASKSGYAAQAHELPGKLSLSGWAGKAGLRFTKRASLALTLLVSLVLWAAIWALVASLASAMLG